MAKITEQDVKDLGFSKELFNISEDDKFNTLISEVISEHAGLILGKLTSSVYNSTISPTKEYVKRLEKVSIASELWQRRINIILQNVTKGARGEPIGLDEAQEQRKTYSDEAKDLLFRLTMVDLELGI